MGYTVAHNSLHLAFIGLQGQSWGKTGKFLKNLSFNVIFILLLNDSEQGQCGVQSRLRHLQEWFSGE
jgi:hypothetical protein